MAKIMDRRKTGYPNAPLEKNWMYDGFHPRHPKLRARCNNTLYQQHAKAGNDIPSNDRFFDRIRLFSMLPLDNFLITCNTRKLLDLERKCDKLEAKKIRKRRNKIKLHGANFTSTAEINAYKEVQEAEKRLAQEAKLEKLLLVNTKISQDGDTNSGIHRGVGVEITNFKPELGAVVSTTGPKSDNKEGKEEALFSPFPYIFFMSWS